MTKMARMPMTRRITRITRMTRMMTRMAMAMTMMMTFNQAWSGPPPITTPLHHIQQITLFIIT